MRWQTFYHRIITLTAIMILTSSCVIFSEPLAGPFSLNEIQLKLDKVGSTFPLYVPGTTESSVVYTTLFYLYDDGSIAYLKTSFFAQNVGVQNNLFAVMYTRSTAPPLEIATNKDEKVKILWAHDQSALTCLVLSVTPYQTCLFWQSNGYWFEFYSILSLDETTTLINALKRVR